VGLLALTMIAGYYRIASDPQMAHDLGLGHRSAGAEDIIRAAGRVGLKARTLQEQTPKHLRSAPPPVILQMRDGNFTILTHRLDDGRLRLVHPVTRVQSYPSLEELTQAWSGNLVLVTRRFGGPGADPSTFNLGWFLPSIWRYRHPIGHFLFASLFVQLFALITPLFFQVVIDKVLVHKGGSTLIVIAVGLVAIGLCATSLVEG
jgi:subfamily B ATP-binding cassette protein HlyB/CyaB